MGKDLIFNCIKLMLRLTQDVVEIQMDVNLFDLDERVLSLT
jgi:hypothetical protein